MVVARGLEKRFGDRVAVHRLDLEVPDGGCFGLLGPNGAGKTTTLRMILGLSPPTGGELFVLGRPVPAEAAAVRARVGVVPQADNLDPEFTVAENLLVYARYFGIGRAAAEHRIAELLPLVELADRAGARIATLSGGMKRRLSIARALINDPAMLVLDEPTTGLDPQVRHLIWDRLRALKQRGVTLLLTTHYMEEAERLCDRLAIFDQGRVVDAGSPRELIGRHIEPSVIEFPDHDADLAAIAGALPGVRLQRLGEVCYCYSREPAALLQALEARPRATWLHRPANLEDVFLKLTGHELRE